MKIRLLLAAMGSLACLCLSQGSAAAAPTCKAGPIKIGAVSTITGLADFSDAPKAAKAVFDQLNEAGGINGCKIEYTIADDKGDPQVAAQAARDLIDNKEVFALAGSASFLDCAVNAGTLAKNDVVSVQGVGIDPLCFNTPNISPVNVGPYTLTTVMLDYATKELKSEKTCAFIAVIGGTQEAYAGAIAAWEKRSGKKITLVDWTLPLQGDLTPYLIKARDAGCDAVLTNQVEPGVVQWIKTADAQKISGINWLFLASGYTEGVAKALADSKQPIYLGTEWEPYTLSDNEANKDWASTMSKAGLPKTAFSQGGYLAAKIMVDTISGINGEVSRDSITAALKAGKELKYPIAGSAYVFGPGKKHSSMQASKIMQLVDGKWTIKTPGWFTLAAAK
ncbi:branched-chain amino acid transport system substrate-binding protein [Rhizobium sp. BK347]|nr:branched-chain amino acid transport system substrate-binding protein [Rhizobium sp. BK252]MBB3403804.1 branched-chain amino acid transport system substrate-binding protein [Rhizobium sp. BK289]MBB3416527.1 branched-chain amino acid transport system substrate-binding protein [Rhizobium sp. BK284]MBB3484267.1 branched-chain amino acid transport system substrate-binding protein [Rhizobium sp. BK347]